MSRGLESCGCKHIIFGPDNAYLMDQNLTSDRRDRAVLGLKWMELVAVPQACPQVSMMGSIAALACDPSRSRELKGKHARA